MTAPMADAGYYADGTPVVDLDEVRQRGRQVAQTLQQMARHGILQAVFGLHLSGDVGAMLQEIACLRRLVAAAGRSRVGQIFDAGAGGIPADVVEVVDAEGDRWLRAGFIDRSNHEDDTGQLADWVTASGSGWCSTAGLLECAPVQVVRVIESETGR